MDWIWRTHKDDGRYDCYRRRAIYRDGPFSINDQGQIKYKGRVWLPDNEKLKIKYLQTSITQGLLFILEG